jgi:hypothetical protein
VRVHHNHIAAQSILPATHVGHQHGLFKLLNCSSAKRSLFRQKGGAKLTDSGARSSQSRQARFEGQDSQACATVAYSKVSRGTTHRTRVIALSLPVHNGTDAAHTMMWAGSCDDESFILTFLSFADSFVI